MVETIQHYDASTRKLEQPLNYKVKRLLELGLIRRITDGLYEVLPIPGYNITTYTIKEHMGRLFCNCQAGRKRDCSHAQAVRIYRERTESREQQLHNFGDLFKRQKDNHWKINPEESLL